VNPNQLGAVQTPGLCGAAALGGNPSRLRGKPLRKRPNRRRSFQNPQAECFGEHRLIGGRKHSCRSDTAPLEAKNRAPLALHHVTSRPNSADSC